MSVSAVGRSADWSHTHKHIHAHTHTHVDMVVHVQLHMLHVSDCNAEKALFLQSRHHRRHFVAELAMTKIMMLTQTRDLNVQFLHKRCDQSQIKTHILHTAG